MKISDNGIRLVKGFEGYHRRLPNGDCTTYYCPADVLTIGYGCTEGIKEGDVWTEAQATEALMRELAKHEAAVTRLVTVEINQHQFDALVSFSYNCGSGALAKSTLLQRVNAKDFDGAAKAFAAWNKGGGRVLPGLVSRRSREAALFQKPATTVTKAPEPTMPQTVDTPSEGPSGSRKEKTSKMGMGIAAFFYALFVAIKAKIEGLISDPFGALETAHSFISEYGWEFAMVSAAVGFAAFKIISALNHQDYEEGRYTPSGGAA
jgi:lysozyme